MLAPRHFWQGPGTYLFQAGYNYKSRQKNFSNKVAGKNNASIAGK